MADFCTSNGTLDVDKVLNGLLHDDCFIREVIGDIRSGQEESDGYWNSECEGLASGSDDFATISSTDNPNATTSLATQSSSADGATPSSQFTPSQGSTGATTATADASSSNNQASTASSTAATTIALFPWAAVTIAFIAVFGY